MNRGRSACSGQRDRRVQRPRAVRQPRWQVGCRLICFGRGGDLQEGTGVRGYKTLDMKLAAGEGSDFGTLRGLWKVLNWGGAKLDLSLQKRHRCCLWLQCFGTLGCGIANTYKHWYQPPLAWRGESTCTGRRQGRRPLPASYYYALAVCAAPRCTRGPCPGDFAITVGARPVQTPRGTAWAGWGQQAPRWGSGEAMGSQGPPTRSRITRSPPPGRQDTNEDTDQGSA